MEDQGLIEIGTMEQRTVFLPGWNVELTVLFTTQGPYFIIRQLCAVLGITDVAQQTTRLRDHEVLRRLIRKMPVTTTTRGRQTMMCIHRRGIGWWWGGINLSKVRPEARANLLKLQEDIVDAAERAMFGEVATDVNERIANLEAFSLAMEQRVGRIETQIDMPLLEDGESEQ